MEDKSRVRPLLLFALLAGLGLAGGLALTVLKPAKLAEENHQPPGIEGLIWPNSLALKPFSIVDHQGANFGLEQLAGKWSFLFFGYVHCPDVCPLTLAVLNNVSQILGSQSDVEGPLQFVFVSIDPDRDTIGELSKHIENFSDNFVAATGSEQDLATLTQQVGIASARNPQADGPYLVDHTSAVLLIDPDGNLVGLFSAPHEANAMASRFRQIVTYVQEHG